MLKIVESVLPCRLRGICYKAETNAVEKSVCSYRKMRLYFALYVAYKIIYAGIQKVWWSGIALFV